MVDEDPTPTTIINLDTSQARINADMQQIDDVEAQLQTMNLGASERTSTIINIPELLKKSTRPNEDEPMNF